MEESEHLRRDRLLVAEDLQEARHLQVLQAAEAEQELHRQALKLNVAR
eukprot:CAMPEP_0172862664 /NCGR_PEP_ID=MMETSP1075-20121228/74953_1 /TAXON_ID=2916 /ORGANISM="Ceratium fusus, Strain PA161109" /LENGTH=47 /DNA_ID= /DNA_START= /DNA_END= /DNA_ORIENTATION=